METIQLLGLVKMWEEDVIIPTYEVYPPEKSPIFIEKRAYQGSSGKIYPLSVSEKISDEITDKLYKGIFLENDYLKVMILPELGGRIQRAIDKTNKYDFVYYNHVIKPALVGLAGPWISGGIEFNWPQHHRPSTYLPVDYHLSKNTDGSCTVWVGEVDRMYGTKGMAGITLYKDKAYIEIKGQLYNKTDMAQTFLWWANPAVPVNDNTISVFPPDVHAVMDHGKRAVSTFPIATGEYYKYDYSKGVDISMYKNIEVPTSYMAYQSNFDFIGNYDQGIEAGLLHIADHHISPGKKQWTWGNGDFGQAWDRNLTDNDGPYIELMTGVFTDNQPDFTWLKPHEEKTFNQYFMPYKGVGRVKNATRDAAVNCEFHNGEFDIRVYVTSVQCNAKISLLKNEEVLYEKLETLTPQMCFMTKVKTVLTEMAGISLVVTNEVGRLLVCYDAVDKELKPIPKPAENLEEPKKLKSIEELYLAATHLEQYRHATYEPEDYYLEGLKRDMTDIRLNNGYGTLLYKRGKFKESIMHFQVAIDKQTWKNPNPYYGESYFNLGVALVADERDLAAYDAFYKSTWSNETQGVGFYWLACLSIKNNEFEKAMEFIEKSLINNWHNMKARALKASIMKRLNKDDKDWLSESLDIDPLDYGCRFEMAITTNDMTSFIDFMQNSIHNYLEIALDYLKCGLYENVLTILNCATRESPIVNYYKAYAYTKLNLKKQAMHECELGEAALSDYCFPNRIEEITILENAIDINPNASFAKYYLGNLLYDKKEYQRAIELWEASIKLNDKFAVVYRNLSIAYFNKENDNKKALKYIRTAFSIEPNNSRFLMEYNLLMGMLGYSNQNRLELLENNLAIVHERDALYLEYITLLNNVGRYDEALFSIENHIFHPWEGGEGKVSIQYKYALTEMALREIKDNNLNLAIDLLERTFAYPKNLGEGKLPNVQDNISNHYLGVIYRRKNDLVKATDYFTKASIGLLEPSSVLYYNDQPADTIFYQGLAHKALGNSALAKERFHQLVAYGEKHIFDDIKYDFFAVSLPEINVYQEDIQKTNKLYCNYLMALGKLGLEDNLFAKTTLTDILLSDPSYQGAIKHLKYDMI